MDRYSKQQAQERLSVLDGACMSIQRFSSRWPVRCANVALTIAALGSTLIGCAEPSRTTPVAKRATETGVQVAAAPAPRPAAEQPQPIVPDPATETKSDPVSPAATAETATRPTVTPVPTSPPVAAPNTTRPSRGAVSGRTRDITFDDLKFEMEKGGPFERSMLTPSIEALEGQTVRLRGFILPSFQQAGIKQFVLVRDNMECCFGPGAALYDCVYVEMAPGKTADFTIYPVAVEGVFHVKEWIGPDGKHLAIYSMEGQQAK
jgi:hypothetical protein